LILVLLAGAPEDEATDAEHCEKNKDDDNPWSAAWIMSEWVLNLSFNNSFCGIRGKCIRANHNKVLIVIKPCVEIAQENSAKTILIGAVRNALEADETVVVLVWELIEITSWLNVDLGALKGELDVAVQVVEV